ncbi:unnamed protein product [Penicillium viridicatum]
MRLYENPPTLQYCHHYHHNPQPENVRGSIFGVKASHFTEGFMDEAGNYDPKGLSQLCASFDEGGGVALGDAFAIYSIVASSPDWSTTSSKSGFQAELISAASAVGNVIPVLVTTENVFTVNIVSLPCLKHPPFNSTREISPRDSLPWFLINASKFSKHQIVGRKDIVESLLIILQRPWCVLELCCCDSPTISAIHRFAAIATKLNPELYNQALSTSLAQLILVATNFYLRSIPWYKLFKFGSHFVEHDFYGRQFLRAKAHHRPSILFKYWTDVVSLSQFSDHIHTQIGALNKEEYLESYGP